MASPPASKEPYQTRVPQLAPRPKPSKSCSPEPFGSAGAKKVAPHGSSRRLPVLSLRGWKGPMMAEWHRRRGSRQRGARSQGGGGQQREGYAGTEAASGGSSRSGRRLPAGGQGWCEGSRLWEGKDGEAHKGKSCPSACACVKVHRPHQEARPSLLSK